MLAMPTKPGAQDIAVQGLATPQSPPTYPPLERSVGDPSTPKGVGREAPLTARLRCAVSAGRSVGQNPISRWGSRGGRAGGRSRGSSVHRHFALPCGWSRSPAADHPQSPSQRFFFLRFLSGDWLWSAAGELLLTRDGNDGGQGAVRGVVEAGLRTDRTGTKGERNHVRLRIGIPWGRP